MIELSLLGGACQARDDYGSHSEPGRATVEGILQVEKPVTSPRWSKQRLLSMYTVQSARSSFQTSVLT